MTINNHTTIGKQQPLSIKTTTIFLQSHTNNHW